MRSCISLGMEVSQVEKAMDENPDAVAVLVNNPTYYGICSDLRTIVKKAHARGMKVLADEAHGTHLYFGRNLPVSGMAAGAHISTSARICRSPRWPRAPTSPLFPCTNPAEV